MSGMTYQRNRDVILNRAKYYYENNKERLTEFAKSKYRTLSEEDKNQKKEYGGNRYHDMSEEKKLYQKYQKAILAISKKLSRGYDNE